MIVETIEYLFYVVNCSTLWKFDFIAHIKPSNRTKQSLLLLNQQTKRMNWILVDLELVLLACSTRSWGRHQHTDTISMLFQNNSWRTQPSVAPCSRLKTERCSSAVLLQAGLDCRQVQGCRRCTSTTTLCWASIAWHTIPSALAGSRVRTTAAVRVTPMALSIVWRHWCR